MWPFKRKPNKVDDRVAPCGYKDHFRWVDTDWPCPSCSAAKKVMEDSIKEEQYLNRLADKIVERLKKKGTPR